MSHIEVTTADRITSLRFARAEKKHAITLEMYGDMRGALEAAGADANVRAVIIAGTKDTFTAGNDIGDFVRAGQGGGGDMMAPLAFLRALASFEKPVLAAVNGVAIGIGTTLLLHCDLVFAGPTARFKTPFVDLGLVPEAASSLLLPALVGERRAAQLLLLGEQIDASTALAWGLVNSVSDDPEAAAQAAARQLASRAPTALRQSKALMRRVDREAILETMRIEGEAFAERLR